MINKLFVIGLLLFFSSFVNTNEAQSRLRERIISYDSEITINEDASMIVVEKIKVHVEGIKIKRGIFRDFPTQYKDNYGNNYNVKFEVLEIVEYADKCNK